MSLIKGLKHACDVINAFPKAARPQVSKNRCRPNVKNRVKVSTPATFRNQFMWLTVAFGNPSVTALAALGKNGQKQNTALFLYDSDYKQ
jgi:hypothetical protein